MRYVYWNSPLFVPEETLVRINRRENPGVLELFNGPILIYGDLGLHLEGCRTKDLQIFNQTPSLYVLEWTRPAGAGTDSANRPVKFGIPLRQRVEFSL